MSITYCDISKVGKVDSATHVMVLSTANPVSWTYSHIRDQGNLDLLRSSHPYTDDSPFVCLITLICKAKPEFMANVNIQATAPDVYESSNPVVDTTL